MFHGYSLMFGESYLGRRVLDALMVIDLLIAEGAREVHLYGRGQGALIALFAALEQPHVGSVTLKHLPPRYEDWVRAPLVEWPAANVLWGALRHLDLDDCVRALGDRVRFLEPQGVELPE